MVHVLEKVISQEDSGGMHARLAFFMSTLTDEIAEELQDMDEVKVRVFMFQIGEVISWIGHGDNERLSDFVRPFAEMIQPSVNNADEQPSTPRELDSTTG